MTDWGASTEWAAGEPEPFVTSSWGDGNADESSPVVTEDYGVIEGCEVPDSPVEDKKLKRVRKKDIEQLQTERQDGEEKFISIWYRAAKGKPLTAFIDKFPRNAAKAFSEVWQKELDNAGGMAVLVIEGEDMEPYKRLLDWINLCVDQGNDIKFPEIEGEDNAINILVDIIAVANKLMVPEMSLQEHLKKSVIKYARKDLIEIENVERIYDVDHFEYLGPSEALREAAAASIFEAWWSRKLDEPKYDDYCLWMEQMRIQFPQLDDDINKRFDDKKQFIEKKEEERKAQKVAAAATNDGPGDGGSGHNTSYSNTNGADGGWGTAAAAVGDGTGEWGVTEDVSHADDGGAATDGWGNMDHVNW